MVRRTHKEIRIRILSSLSDEPLPIRVIAQKSKVDWYSTERHLNYLKGREVVTEVFRHKLLRLFTLTPFGQQIAMELKKRPSIKNQSDKQQLVKIINRII